MRPRSVLMICLSIPIFFLEQLDLTNILSTTNISIILPGILGVIYYLSVNDSNTVKMNNISDEMRVSYRSYRLHNKKCNICGDLAREEDFPKEAQYCGKVCQGISDLSFRTMIIFIVAGVVGIIELVAILPVIITEYIWIVDVVLFLFYFIPSLFYSEVDTFDYRFEKILEEIEVRKLGEKLGDLGSSNAFTHRTYEPLSGNVSN